MGSGRGNGPSFRRGWHSRDVEARLSENAVGRVVVQGIHEDQQPIVRGVRNVQLASRSDRNAARTEHEVGTSSRNPPKRFAPVPESLVRKLPS